MSNLVRKQFARSITARPSKVSVPQAVSCEVTRGPSGPAHSVLSADGYNPALAGKVLVVLADGSIGLIDRSASLIPSPYTLYVDPNVSDPAADGTPEHPFQTGQAAVDKAATLGAGAYAGVCIHIASGVVPIP